MNKYLEILIIVLASILLIAQAIVLMYGYHNASSSDKELIEC